MIERSTSDAHRGWPVAPRDGSANAARTATPARVGAEHGTAGEYYIAAVAEPEMMLDNDEMATMLGALRRVATRITLHAGDQQRYEPRPVRLRR